MPSTVGTAPSPTQAGIISSCKGWYLATQGDSCDLVPQVFGTFDESSFLSWNPALGGSGCSGLVIGDYYCIAVPGTPTTRTSLPSSSPTQTNGAGPQPEQPGIPADCSSYWLVSSTDNCTTIAAANGITEQQLNSWNPSLGGVDCPNLLPDYYVCVKAGSAGTSVPATGTTTRTSTTTHASTTTTTTTTTTTGTSTTSPPLTTPTPIQPNMSPTCNRFYLVQPGDGCFAIAASANIPLATFYALNPSVGSDCANLLSGFYVCLGAASDGSGAPATTISTGAPVAATPSPVQSGMVAGCRRFYLVEGGDSCFGIASAAGVDLSLFGTWNPAVGASSGCGGLLSGEFVCIGVSGGGGVRRRLRAGGRAGCDGVIGTYLGILVN
ncbi:hypothetical protein B0T17DRAFT_265186 [Bombardia bombarda]|uniref:LysM domain-containing protein n=1 Tax=Bombardia bombarda TaxID=252184 RepID=A0AA40C5N6_9PEZI|nr:hypothetical protein B0T17DRAFT_265186 [Bombardia bombarda]